ncbi:isoprenylcysteine carboxylmethyltransferase family protein [bacterium]|nr:isoprenylcysteine carboxylmethyltransferase family protein [bacterium]RQV97944.1 MAG: isoprenylcysteine carboxylmethyltransferase family protein [bacterium]
MFFLWSGVCFVSYFLRTVFNVLKYQKNPMADRKIMLNIVYIVMAVLWFSWFQMCFFDPMKINIPVWARISGLVLFIVGVFLFIYSHINLKGFTGKGTLVKGGIYSKIRNPMYFGFIIWIIGFPVFMRSFATLISSVVWISFILYWKLLEEKDLEKQYSEYREYKRKTWF